MLSTEEYRNLLLYGHSHPEQLRRGCAQGYTRAIDAASAYPLQIHKTSAVGCSTGLWPNVGTVGMHTHLYSAIHTAIKFKRNVRCLKS